MPDFSKLPLEKQTGVIGTSSRIEKLFQDPKFHKLSQEAQVMVMGRTDPRFSSLSDSAKEVVLNKISSGLTPPQVATEEKKGSSLTREIARTGGGIAGGLAAAGLPEPAKFLTVPAGVAAGAAAGDSFYQIAQHIFGDPEAPKTSLEALKGMGWAGAREGAFELGGGLVAKGAMKALSPFKKTLDPEAMRLTGWLKDKIKPVFLPAEATQSKFLDVMQNITEGSILGGMKFEKFKHARAGVLSDVADDVISMFGKKVEPDEVGELFVDALENRNKTFGAVSNALYNTATELGEGSIVNIKPLKDFAKTSLGKVEDLKGLEAESAGDNLLKTILGMDDSIDISAAKELKSRLFAKADEYKILNKSAKIIGKTKKLNELLFPQIMDSLPDKAKTAWRQADTFHKTMSKKFNSTLLRRLVKKGEENPQAISRAIFKPNNFKTISKVKAALNPKEWEAMQSYLMQDVFQRATREATTDASGKIIESTLMGQRMIDILVGKNTGIGLKSLNHTFSSEQLKGIFNLANTLKIAQKKQGEGLGRMWIQLAQGGAAVTVATGGWGLAGAGDAGDTSMSRLLGSGLILFGPAVMSRMMLKPSVIKYLTKGISLPANSPEVLGIITRLTAFARKTQQERTEETLKEGKGPIRKQNR